MNRIYKVIWSKVKHQYVVVSELAHRDGKRSSAASKSVRTLLAVLAVCGMTAFGLGMQDVYAGQGEGVTASAGQYVAIGEASYKDADNYNWWEGYNPNKTYTQNIDGHTYIYTKTEAGNFWVREGYTIKVAHDQRFPGTNEGIDTVIETYKGENADTTGILQSYQNVESNMGVSTLNGKHLQTTTTDMYVGAVNTPTTEITSAGNQFYIYRGSHWVNVGQDNFASNFNYRDVIYDEATGLYTFHGEVVSTENLYSINGNVGVFTTTPGGTEVYTGDVYGWNNEILVTGVDEDGNYVSYWGSENVDPNAPIGNMPMSTLQYKFDVVNDNIEAVAEDNIKQINIGQSGNDGQVNISKTDNGQGGTIGLQTNGTFDEDGNPTGGAMIPGGIKITSEHGNDGKDVRIKFANDAGSFTVDAGSKVVGRTDAGVANEGDTLTSVDINGKNYLLGGGKTYTAGNNINIDDNNVISTTKTTVSADNNFIVDSKEDTQKNVTDYNIKLNNVVTIGSGEGSHPVKIDGVNGQVTGLTNTSLDVDGFGKSNRAATEEQLQAMQTSVTAADKYITGGTIDTASGTLKLTGTNGLTANVSGLTDYQVTQDGSGYDAESHKLTLNLKDTLNTSNPAQQVTFEGIAGMADVAKATTEVKAGTNVASVDKTEGADGHAVYTVNAKGTTVSADDNFIVDAQENSQTNVTDYNIKLNNVVTIGSGEGSHPVKIDGVKGEVTGLTNTTLDVDGFAESHRAATEEQLQAMQTSVTAADKYITGGTIDTTSGTLQLTGTNGLTANVSGLTDYQVTQDGSGYDAESHKLTLNLKDTLNTSNPAQQVTFEGIAGMADVAKATTEVKAGTNVASVDKTEGADGHAVYTVNAKGTTVSADDNFIVDAQENSQTNVTDYNIKLNNVVTIGSGEGSHPVKIDGVNGQVTGLTNTSLDVDGFGESNRAATEEQLKAVSDKVGEVSIEAEKHSTVTGDKENITVIPEEQADGHLNYEVTLHDNLYLSGENDAFVQVLGTAGKINLGGGNNIISIDGALGQISGLSNLTWNPMKNYEGSSLAATESQLHDAFGYLNDKIDSIDITGDDNITVDKSENTSEGSGSGSGSTGEETTGKGPHFDIGLKDDVTLGTTNEDGDVTTSGSLTIKDTSGNTITINQKDETGKGNGLVSGLTNTDWDWNKYGKPVAEGGYAGSTNAATESQLNGAIEGVMESTVQYDKVKDEDGNVTVDKSHITLNEGGTTITNVAAGKNDMDAVNYSQLKNVQQQVTNNSLAINNIGSKVGELDSRIDKVGAGAAALAALHPLDFDPDDKWDFAAGYGNYRGESAVAIGAFYRPNEDTMFSVGGTVGNDDNMVNAGVSFKIGQGSGISTSRVAMAKEIKAMRDVVAKQDAQIQKLTAMVNALVGVQAEPDTTTMFPDVPENHWAYEAVASMAKSGLVEGYPDGEFKGDRTMTRYEFAQIIQNAIQKGAEVDARLVQEFKPELEYFHIATVAKDKDGNPTIERVRAN